MAHTRRRIDSLADLAARTPGVDPAVADAMRAVDPARSLLFGHYYDEPPILSGSFRTGATGLRAGSLATPRHTNDMTWWVLDWDRLPSAFAPGLEQDYGYVEDRRFIAPHWDAAATLMVEDPTPREAVEVSVHLGAADVEAALRPLRGMPTQQNHEFDPAQSLVVVVRLGQRNRGRAVRFEHVHQRVRVMEIPDGYPDRRTTWVYALPLADLADETTVVGASPEPRRLVDGAWA